MQTTSLIPRRRCRPLLRPCHLPHGGSLGPCELAPPTWSVLCPAPENPHVDAVEPRWHQDYIQPRPLSAGPPMRATPGPGKQKNRILAAGPSSGKPRQAHGGRTGQPPKSTFRPVPLVPVKGQPKAGLLAARHQRGSRLLPRPLPAAAPPEPGPSRTSCRPLPGCPSTISLQNGGHPPPTSQAGPGSERDSLQKSAEGRLAPANLRPPPPPGLKGALSGFSSAASLGRPLRSSSSSRSAAGAAEGSLRRSHAGGKRAARA